MSTEDTTGTQSAGTQSADAETAAAGAAAGSGDGGLSVPTLGDGALTLRELRAADAEALTANCQDPEAVRWTTVPEPYGVESALWYIQQHVPGALRAGEAVNWAVEDPQGRFLGTIELCRLRAGAADIGLNFGPHARGTGAAEGACRLVIDHAFGPMGLTHLHWQAFDGNWASRKLAWKLGFSDPVLVRGFMEQRGQLRDTWIATLAADAPRSPSQPWTGPGADGGGAPA
ncbi:GNAT family N-acetyltransferase [Kocuria palustris]|uniref:GNAT family N-acetyltransferase n=1 Tax=Kocuria palustris TaxID=71999 RepID=UPI0011A1EF0D|nr:GNAT family N-acetyltransferase [Kocuria palustris]